MNVYNIITGNSLSSLRKLDNNFYHSCVTSPPYYLQRDCGDDRQIGNEDNIEDYIHNIVEIFSEVRRVLRNDGTIWINLGDKYDKNKNLYGLPFLVATALKSDGWYWRNIHPWLKNNSIPEGTTDRAHNSIEWVIHLSKSKNYYYDPEAAKECLGIKRNWRNGDALSINDSFVFDINTVPSQVKHFSMMPAGLAEIMIRASTSDYGCDAESGEPYYRKLKKTRRATRPGKSCKNDNSGKVHKDRGRHVTEVKTMGWKLDGKNSGQVEKCRVIDPFSGIGTTGEVALKLNRSYIGIDIKEEYNLIAINRLNKIVNNDCFI